MALSWSPEKEELFRFESNILVSASAGTGKTTALVELYRRIIAGETSFTGHGGIGIENILAITFTNKAARQMRERLGSELAGSRAAHDGLLTDAHILTFHSFCTRILKEHAFEAGLSPDFSVVEGLEAALLLESAIVDELSGALENGSPELIRQLRKRSYAGLKRLLIRMVLIHQGAEILFPDKEAVRRTTKRMLVETYSSYQETLLDLQADFQEGNIKEKYLESLENIKRHWSDASASKILPLPETNFKNGWEFFNKWELILKGNKILKGRPHHPLYKGLKSLRDGAFAVFCQMKSLPDIVDMLTLARRAKLRYDGNKRDANLLDFNDIERMTIKLLEDRLDIREELQRRFHAILIDEYQDTNDVQEQLLEYIGRDEKTARRLSLPRTRYLRVGDRKQSIYRFRGADVTVFREKELFYRDDNEGGKILNFADNFRSSPALLKFFNSFFSFLMGIESGESYEVGYTKHDDLFTGLPNESQVMETPVELLVVEKTGKMEQLRLAEARAIASRLKELVGGEAGIMIRSESGESRLPRWGDMAILLRRMTHSTAYERALREAGIPFGINQSSGFFERQEVMDLVNLLRFINQPLAPLPRLAVLRSPAVHLSDLTIAKLMEVPDENWLTAAFDQERHDKILKYVGENSSEYNRLERFLKVITKICRRRPYQPVSELLETLLNELDLSIVARFDFEGERQRANQEKLIDIARAWERSRPGFGQNDFLRRVDDILRLTEREGEGMALKASSQVQIITIHQAKGLEFPIVILPDLCQKPPPNKSGLFMRAKGQFGIKFFDPIEHQKYDTYDFLSGKDEDYRQESAENRRLLYVALTRARDYLILSGDKELKPKKESKGKSKDKSRASQNWFETILDFFSTCPVSPRTTEVSIEENGGLMEKRISMAPEPAFKNLSEMLKASEALSPLDDDGELLGTFSVSLLQDLMQCKRCYLLRRLLDRSTLLWMEPDPGDDLDVVAEPEGRMLGSILHRYFEGLGDDGTASLEGWEKFLQNMGSDLNEPWAKEISEKLESVGDFPIYAGEIPGRKYRELPFLSQITLPSGRAIRLKGRIDAVKIGTEGGFCLVDYKYAAYNEARDAVYRFQIQSYAAVLREAIGTAGNKSRAYICYFRDGEPWREVTVTDNELNDFLGDLEKRIEDAGKIENLAFEELEALPYEMCIRKECRYLELCHPMRQE